MSIFSGKAVQANLSEFVGFHTPQEEVRKVLAFWPAVTVTTRGCLDPADAGCKVWGSRAGIAVGWH